MPTWSLALCERSERKQDNNFEHVGRMMKGRDRGSFECGRGVSGGGGSWDVSREWERSMEGGRGPGRI